MTVKKQMTKMHMNKKSKQKNENSMQMNEKHLGEKNWPLRELDSSY